MKTPRILIAGVPETYERLSTILTGYNPEFADTFSQAKASLKSTVYQLVMIGIHFDDSRLFDLLRYLKGSESHAHVSVLCYRGTTGAETRTKLTVQAVGIACRALGASGFLDLFEFPDEEAGNGALRVDQLLVAHGVAKLGC